jgi:acetyl esterase/lipase
LKVDIEPLSDGKSSLLWIGDRKRASKFVYFMHGGGYVVPAQVGHMEWCARAYLLAPPAVVAADEGEQRDEVAVAVLQYSHSPAAKYPAQLQQAADGLIRILTTSSPGGVRPGNLVIGGDSAGGNLVAQLLGHLLHPHPAVREVKLVEPLAAAFLVSPWLSATNDWPSVRRNGGIDMISAGSMPMVSAGILDDGSGQMINAVEEREGKGWAMPMDLPEEKRVAWFRGLGGVVEKVYVTAGEQEILLDQCVALVDAVRRGNDAKEVEVRFDVMRDEAHDWVMLEGQREVDGEATRRMREWFRGVFWG